MSKTQVSTGIPGLDQTIDWLRIGDNVVWQVGSIAEYKKVVTPFARQSRQDGYRVVYVRFGYHASLLTADEADQIYLLDPSKGFEDFATKTHKIISAEGERVCYVFDCLSDLLEHWYSDLMIGNFFRVSCPFLYRLNTVAYFALMRGTHTYSTIARIRKTTQLLLDLFKIEGKTYIHPLKASMRYSPTMFFPHLMDEGKLTPITSSADTAMLFADQWQLKQPHDFWEVTLDRAKAALTGGAREQEQMKSLLIGLIISQDTKIRRLFDQYLTLPDLLYIASREIGSGYLGGKSVGFLLARRILETDAPRAIQTLMEPHDSYFLGSDLYYTYIIQNDCWHLLMKQKTPEGYFTHAGELQEKIMAGSFPRIIREQFVQMLEYFGQAPIIVRSSSLLEDAYGNAFAGKYESVFCANQGSPEQRYQAFEQAVRTVYASTMNENALKYRLDRGLMDKDEQMAILVQRVSGDHYGRLFFPHIAGVANSVNLYLWEPALDPAAGMLRLVFGLGTRAVDRIPGDYARIVALDQPAKIPPINHGEEAKYSQRYADALDLQSNLLTANRISEIAAEDIKADKTLFFSPDEELAARMRETGRSAPIRPVITSFPGLLRESEFPQSMRTILATLEKAYDYPVDVEFTANFDKESNYRINVLQCRPLQTRGVGVPKETPQPADDHIVFKTSGSFMGGNIHLPIDKVIIIDPEAYLLLPEQDRFLVARAIGRLNAELGPARAMLIGPGRWGTTTTSLGTPVHFTDLNHMAVLIEATYQKMTPELSFGSHFFQDLTESNIFYGAVYDKYHDTVFHPERIMDVAQPVGFEDLSQQVREALLVAEPEGLFLHSNVVEQLLVCYFE